MGAAPPDGHASFGAGVRAWVLVVFMYLLMPIWGLVFLIPSILSYRCTLWTMKTYVKIVFFALRHLCGTRCELRGTLPQGPCIVASKHQSFLDVMMLMLWLPHPRFVMKRSIMYAPVLGIYAMRLGCVPIDRSRGGEAVRSMMEGVAQKQGRHGQIIIFPQGTRVAPGVRQRYKSGVVRLYEGFKLPIELGATNTGWFWPRTGTRRSKGTAVLEFFDTIPEGRGTGGLLAEIEEKIESASDALASEAAAGFGHDR